MHIIYGHHTWADISVDVGHGDTLQVPADCEAEEHHLNGGQEELDEEQQEVSVDVHSILPTQSQNVQWAWHAIGRVARACISQSLAC